MWSGYTNSAAILTLLRAKFRMVCLKEIKGNFKCFHLIVKVTRGEILIVHNLSNLKQYE